MRWYTIIRREILSATCPILRFCSQSLGWSCWTRWSLTHQSRLARTFATLALARSLWRQIAAVNLSAITKRTTGMPALRACRSPILSHTLRCDGAARTGRSLTHRARWMPPT